MPETRALASNVPSEYSLDLNPEKMRVIFSRNGEITLPFTGVGNIANMSLNAIRENKTLAKISKLTVFNILGHKLALLYNLRVYLQFFALVGGTSRRRVSPYKSEYLYIHEYLYNKTLVS